MNPLLLIALPSLIGTGIVVLGTKSGQRSALAGMGDEGSTNSNLLATQQYQTNALMGTAVVVGLLAVPVVSALIIFWMIKKS